MWQVQSAGDGAFMMLGSVVTTYASLSGACSAHGYAIPSLGS